MIGTTQNIAREILDIIKDKNIIISTRDKNLEFLKKYNLKQIDVIDIINNLNEFYFIEKRKNKDKNIKSEYLYIFKPLIQLTDFYGETLEYVYIKICEISSGIFVVSIHEDDI